MLGVNANANKIAVIDSSRDWIRILIEFNVWFTETPEQITYRHSQAIKIGERHCAQFNRKLYRFLSQMDGAPLADSFNWKLGKNIHNFYCANNLKEALKLYESSGLPKHEYWAGPILFETGPYYYEPKNIRNTLVQIEERKRQEDERQRIAQLEQERLTELQRKKILELQKQNASNNSFSGRERAISVAKEKFSNLPLAIILAGVFGVIGTLIASDINKRRIKKINPMLFGMMGAIIGLVLANLL